MYKFMSIQWLCNFPFHLQLQYAALGRCFISRHILQSATSGESSSAVFVVAVSLRSSLSAPPVHSHTEVRIITAEMPMHLGVLFFLEDDYESAMVLDMYKFLWTQWSAIFAFYVQLQNSLDIAIFAFYVVLIASQLLLTSLFFFVVIDYSMKCHVGVSIDSILLTKMQYLSNKAAL